MIILSISILAYALVWAVVYRHYSLDIQAIPYYLADPKILKEAYSDQILERIVLFVYAFLWPVTLVVLIPIKTYEFFIALLVRRHLHRIGR